MDVVWLGFRGFPGVMGGVETHAEQICPRLAELGCTVEVIGRAGYLPTQNVGVPGVRMTRLWAPRSKNLEAFVHTFLGVLYAGIRRPEILHIQAIGPAIMTPLARLLGLRVVVTHHGPDYDRQKWGRLAKWVIKRGESWGMRFANERIVISETIQAHVRHAYGLDSVRIPNGVTLPVIPAEEDALAGFGLTAGRYVLLVSRLVPEKRHDDLIGAFAKAGLPGWKLVIVGCADHPDQYSARVEALAEATPGVVMAGFQTGDVLRQLFAHAGVFVLPSSHEGLPIALLEALSFGLPVLASDIPANLEIGLPAEHYFPLGDVVILAERLRELADAGRDPAYSDRVRGWVSDRYSWELVSQLTLDVYRRVLGH
ncbi:glycosyltransferase family 4 protein [Thiocapsa bogorovii]|uniref:glycosyltransferase family 4 protein n=1 Tax=Thiocapsa bogorovii TaxID=521689 RepID=UPI001E4523A4|nr:glycosyltransferase family 4 protein [Thiocapsa bogorovii]UHD17111.1 glycosyltransferase family 4 protein [Thiocapsa bogorovii]